MQERSLSPLPMLPSPREIIAHLDRFVVGQDEAKRYLATAVYNHYLGLAVRDGSGGGRPFPYGPQHVLLVGPSGSGKSYLVRTLAGFLGVPFSFASATSLVQTGYVGMQAEQMVRELHRRAHSDAFLAERGILFIDEIDKIRRHGTSAGGPDVSGEGAQIGLLTLLDGTSVPITPPGKEGPPGDLDTSRILFICAGAFVGLEEQVERRLGRSGGAIGFRTGGADAPDTSVLRRLQASDLVAFGLLPELVGRFAGWAILDPLEVGDLVRILTEPEDSVLARKRALWREHGIDLEFTPDALREIATLALAEGTGARALHRYVDRTLDDVDWRPVELMKRGVKRIVVGAATVRRESAPEILGLDPFTGEGGPHAADAPAGSATSGSSEVVRAVEKLRRDAFHPSPPESGDASPVGSTDPRHGTEEDIRRRLEEIKEQHLGWRQTTGSARKWWLAFEHENSHRLHLVLRLAEELARREATITEFFLTYVYSNTDNIQANLHYLDYKRLKRREEMEKRKRRARRGGDEDSGDEKEKDDDEDD